MQLITTGRFNFTRLFLNFCIRDHVITQEKSLPESSNAQVISWSWANPGPRPRNSFLCWKLATQSLQSIHDQLTHVPPQVLLVDQQKIEALPWNVHSEACPEYCSPLIPKNVKIYCLTCILETDKAARFRVRIPATVPRCALWLPSTLSLCPRHSLAVQPRLKFKSMFNPCCKIKAWPG